jgi:hypothetical protein
VTGDGVVVVAVQCGRALAVLHRQDAPVGGYGKKIDF